MHTTISRTGARRAWIAGTALTLAAVVSGCAEAELAVGDTTVESAAGQDADAAAPDATPGAATSVAPTVDANDPELEATPVVFGPWTMRLPLGWTAFEGSTHAASGEASTAIGAATYTSVPAAGKDQATWLADLLAGTTDVVAEREGLVEEPSITLADGTQIFHLVHTYSDNRAHIFGHVRGDVLELLRFGLDGTPATAAVTVKSVRTAGISATPLPGDVAPVAPGTPTTPAPSTPAPATGAPTAPDAVATPAA